MNNSKIMESKNLIAVEYGDPLSVIQLVQDRIPEPDSNEVVVQMLMAPVNPVDVNIIQGAYAPFKYPTPFSPGMEGVGKVIKLGFEVKNLMVGDHVIFLRYFGIWRTYLSVPVDILYKIPNTLGLPQASTLFINPPTVYRMLKDFQNLKTGDTVIQNGANSACGILAIQICKIWGLVSVNVVRNRPNIESLKSYLKSLGANYVYTEEEIGDIDIFKSGKALRPTLALNCVGGKSASSIMRHLDIGGVMVTYGGMSLQPVTISTSSLVFRDLSLEGFSIYKWIINEDNLDEMVKMFNDIIGWYESKKLNMPPYVLVKIENFKYALSNTISKKGMVGKKFIFDFSNISNKM